MKTAVTLVFLLASISAFAQRDFQKDVQKQFIEVQDGSTIVLPPGQYFFDASLWLDDKRNVVIRGSGIDETILSFKDQVSGAEGIKVTNASNITLRDLTVQDTKGDGVKAQGVNGISFVNVKTQWTRGAHKNNGGYGLYPVQCTDVLIDSCIAIGASDAGIYVGQSRNIIVRNSTAYANVAGIEIENSWYADVHSNKVYDNTGGILVFDLPGLIEKEGGYIRVFNNLIRENNRPNFAPRGNIVAKVPPGTGLMILAARNVEVFDNRMLNNITAGTAIVSYYITEIPIQDTTYNPYPGNIFIHHNEYERPSVRATGKGRMGKMFRFKLRFGKDVPHIIYDGIEEKADAPTTICIRNNINASFVDIDADNKFRKRSRDLSPFDCEQQPLPPVVLSATDNRR